MNYLVNERREKKIEVYFRLHLGQCAVDEMKSRYSLLHRDQQDYQAIDFNDLSN